MESEYGVYVVLFTFRCEDSENKATKLETREVTLVECAAGKDECEHAYLCGTSEEAVQ